MTLTRQSILKWLTRLRSRALGHSIKVTAQFNPAQNKAVRVEDEDTADVPKGIQGHQEWVYLWRKSNQASQGGSRKEKESINCRTLTAYGGVPVEDKKVMYIEDNIIKYVSVVRFLNSLGIKSVERAGNAENGIEKIEQAHLSGKDYDLLILDMHYDFYGTDDRNAGEKTMNILREKGIDIPVVFCSSQNWKIPGAAGNIFFHEQRNWESEARELFKMIFEKS